MEQELKVGQVVTVPAGPNMAHYVTVTRARSDAYSHSRCARCRQPFSYGPIGQDCITGEAVCARPCD